MSLRNASCFGARALASLWLHRELSAARLRFAMGCGSSVPKDPPHPAVDEPWALKDEATRIFKMVRQNHTSFSFFFLLTPCATRDRRLIWTIMACWIPTSSR